MRNLARDVGSESDRRTRGWLTIIGVLNRGRGLSRVSC